MVDPTAHPKVVGVDLQHIMVATRCLLARYATAVLVISMSFKTMSVRIPVKNHLSVRFVTRDLQESITLRLICDYIRVKNHTVARIAIGNLFKLQT